ncbi:MAG: hypothetical protein ACXQTX_02165 [Candidatus Syntropharchaeia archaeon]
MIEKLEKFLKTSLVVLTIAAMGLGGYVTHSLIKEIKKYRHVVTHLERDAIPPSEIPDALRKFRTTYMDLDRNGYFESILERENHNGSITYIIMERGKNGKIRFANLSERAVDPLNIPKNARVDYIDVNKDSRLESVIHFKNHSGDVVRIVMERGKYGEICFANLSKTAVDPLTLPENARVDYIDLDGDGRLESVAYIGNRKKVVERINGKYVFSDL